MSSSNKNIDTMTVELDAEQRKRLVILICTLLAFSVMNGTMFNVAIPDIAKTFQLLPSEVSWVMTGYIMVFAIGSLMYGKLADIYPVKTILTIGITLFSTGAFIGFLSPNFATLMIARILQAIGGASIPALGFIIPARFLPNERGKVFGIISSTVAFASGVGPIVGGIVGGALNWRFLFLFSVAAAFAIPLFRKWIPEEKVRKGSIDFLGAALIAVSVASLLFYITTFIWQCLLMFGVFLLLFIWRTKTAKHPFIQPGILKNLKYTITVITSFFGVFILFGIIFIVPIMLRDLNELSTLSIGLVLFPGAITAGFIGRICGKMIDEKGGIPVVRTSLILIGTGILLLSTFAGYQSWIISLCLLITYLGFPLIQSSTADLLSSILSDQEQGVGMGLFNLLNFLGGAFSSAIFGRLLDMNSADIHLNPFSLYGKSEIYSNLFLSLSILSVIVLITFSVMFSRISKKTAILNEQ